MKQSEKYSILASPEIPGQKQNIPVEDYEFSIEEFDALEGKHEFSKAYQKRKRRLLREYRKRILLPKKSTYAKIAAAAAVLLISAPIIANAATDGKFFNRIWGSLGKKDVASHEEILYNEQELPYVYTFPQREYIDVEPEKAEKLLGAHVSHERLVENLGDTTLTILSAVQDGNAAIVEFTLERKGGVNAFTCSQFDNEFHGAEFSQDVPFWFHFPSCSENILIDRERSTEELFYCYNYMTMEPDSYDEKAKGIVMEIDRYPCTRRELFEADEKAFDKYRKETDTVRITVPFPSPIETTAYANPDGGIADISPISVKVDMDTGLGLEEKNAECYDMANIYYTSINYKDGTKYIVQEHALEKIHSCDTNIDNTCCISCDTQGNLIFVFNRLVDTDSIASITVNEATYTRKAQQQQPH